MEPGSPPNSLPLPLEQFFQDNPFQSMAHTSPSTSLEPIQGSKRKFDTSSPFEEPFAPKKAKREFPARPLAPKFNFDPVDPSETVISSFPTVAEGVFLFGQEPPTEVTEVTNALLERNNLPFYNEEDCLRSPAPPETC